MQSLDSKDFEKEEEPASPEQILQAKLDADEQFLELGNCVIEALNDQLDSDLDLVSIGAISDTSVELVLDLQEIESQLAVRDALINMGIECSPICFPQAVVHANFSKALFLELGGKGQEILSDSVHGTLDSIPDIQRDAAGEVIEEVKSAEGQW